MIFLSQIGTFATREKMPFFPVTARVFGVFCVVGITPVVQGGGFSRLAPKNRTKKGLFATQISGAVRADRPR